MCGHFILMMTWDFLQDECVKMLGMVNQGRPLSALPPGDLKVPAVPNFSCAPLLCLMQVCIFRASTGVT